MAKKVNRRQFLTVSLGAVGTAAAGELTALGLDTAAAQEKALTVPIKRSTQTPRLCPYCSVGCAQIVMTDNSGKIIDIQGNPDSPISEGTLCPKGAATCQLVVNDLRWTKVKHRAPGSDHWEEKSLASAMNRVAELVKKTRDASFNEFQEMPGGKAGMKKKRVMNTYAVASLGGATIDNEWNYAQQKLMHALGVVYVENQARI
ncbi:MAG: hypothetical protein M1497_04980 [Nitrospirae bacterium]|nr:hypothetical protein [Nitrospirota bacterium]